MIWRVVIATTALTGCGRPAAPVSHAPVQVSITRTGSMLTLRATPMEGTKINALLPPQLELASGRSERLTSSSITADSAYFTAAPEVTIPANTPLGGALIRASVCDSGAAVCRVVTVPL